jgi:serine protease Do
VNKELAESFGMKKPMGAVVLRVLDDTPAKKAGIEVGDVITQFGESVINRSSDLPLAVGKTAIGTRVKVRIIRDGKQKHLTVKIEELPAEDKLAEAENGEKQSTSNRLNIDVVSLTKEQRKSANVENGVLVQSVEEGPADRAGIHPGDILLQLNGKDITGTKQFLAIVDKLPDDKRVSVLIQRGNSPKFLTLRIKE